MYIKWLYILIWNIKKVYADKYGNLNLSNEIIVHYIMVDVALLSMYGSAILSTSITPEYHFQFVNADDSGNRLPCSIVC